MPENDNNTNNDAKQDIGGKKPWTKPTITVLRSGLLNKFGKARQAAWIDSIDDVAIDDLLNQFGSPLFVVSEKKLRRNMQRMKRAFTGRYPNVVFGWSYKTNYLGAICNVLHQEEALAEVVSEFEYEKARTLGVPGHCILFNGPFKKRHILETAIDEGAHIHIDHLDELYELEKIANEKRKKIPVTIRLNFDTGYTEPWSRFGFNVESGQAMDAAWRITTSQYMELVGLHSHIGTFITEPKAYSIQVRTMCNFMEEVEKRTGCSIEYLDIGGGFASLNSLQGIYLPPEQIVPSIEQYAEAICEVLLECTHEREARGCKRPTLVLETGRAMVDDAEVLITTVAANKRLPDGKRAVIVDAGVNLLFTAFWYNHNVTPTRPLPGKPEETVIYGPLCMNIDVMRYSIMLPPLNLGDNLVFSPVGAYNHTQWLQFIEYRPNVVMIHPDKSVSVIRAAENLDVVTAQERIPEHLQQPYTHGVPGSIVKPR
ncbi:MAG: diaminopimelate decarboxylase [Gammaproteobacteria bacterium SG8_11]|nr:MAG: diaminopimelate decarboxylase [Gammaproteobacteria bacterium SG8_11]